MIISMDHSIIAPRIRVIGAMMTQLRGSNLGVKPYGIRIKRGNIHFVCSNARNGKYMDLQSVEENQAYREIADLLAVILKGGRSVFLDRKTNP